MEPIETCLVFLLSKANQQVQAAVRERMLTYGITPTQYAVLRVLWESDGQSAAELGHRLILDPATMVGIVDRLVQNDLVERRPNPKDRRVNPVYLTDKGKNLEKPLSTIAQELNRELEAQFLKEMPKLRKVLTEIGGIELPLKSSP